MRKRRFTIITVAIMIGLACVAILCFPKPFSPAGFEPRWLLEIKPDGQSRDYMYLPAASGLPSRLFAEEVTVRTVPWNLEETVQRVNDDVTGKVNFMESSILRSGQHYWAFRPSGGNIVVSRMNGKTLVTCSVTRDAEWFDKVQYWIRSTFSSKRKAASP